ncbi:MAG: transposase [Nevskiaceae bacterium]|nr:MAG: transposase [Nevskiaceae bacterium]
MYRKPRTTVPAEGRQVYPYLLRDVTVDHVNQVWSTDITYLPMARGFVYLAAVVDWYSRRVLAWRLSNTMTLDFCIEAVTEALARYGMPEIFNSDQGSQGGFNRSLQHWTVGSIVGTRSALRQVSSSLASSEAGYSACGRLPGAPRHPSATSRCPWESTAAATRWCSRSCHAARGYGDRRRRPSRPIRR